MKKVIDEVFVPLAAPSAKVLGEVIGAIFDNLTRNFTEKSEKSNFVSQQRIKKLEALKDLELETIKSLRDIKYPYQYPDINFIEYAAEKAVYLDQEEYIRGKYAKLMTSTFDSSKARHSHIALVDIFMQLSYLDLKICKVIDEEQSYVFITKEYVSDTRSNFNDRVFPFKDNDQFIDSRLSSVSVNNLERLGLIRISDNVDGKGTQDIPLYSEYRRFIESEPLRDIRAGDDSLLPIFVTELGRVLFMILEF